MLRVVEIWFEGRIPLLGRPNEIAIDPMIRAGTMAIEKNITRAIVRTGIGIGAGDILL
jgi:hypothetical protein